MIQNDYNLFEGRKILEMVNQRIGTLEKRLNLVTTLKWKSLQLGYYDKVAQARYLQEKVSQDIANVKSVL